jgi:transposase
MQFIEGKNRDQIVLYSDTLNQIVERDNEVRLIDAFVESISIAGFDFKIKTSREGAPAYHPKDLLKLFVYGYLNRIRSSRQLEKECRRNTEVMWLLKQLVPDHNTIANFRRDNAAAIKQVFRHTVSIAKHFDLIGGKLIAGDSVKLRAQNSRKNNFNPRKLDQHLEYIDKKLDEYNKELEAADEDKKEDFKKEIKKHTERKVKYEAMQEQLKETGDTQISTSDAESRLMIVRNNITEVAYNVQTTVDAKHCLPIDYKVTNQNDSKAMGEMVQHAKEILNTNQFTALYDKGYHTGSELKTAQDLGITTLVAIPAPASTAPDECYNVAHFIYNETDDCYLCPQGNRLTATGTVYTKGRNRPTPKVFRQYRNPKACKSCPVRALCTNNKSGRLIERNIHTPFYEQNARNIAANKTLYKQRQSIVEHPYGTLKRQWGFCYVLTKKGMQRASADVGLMFIAYNLRRIFNILGKNVLMQYLGVLALLFSWISTVAKRTISKMHDRNLMMNLAALLFSPLSYRFKIA